MGGYRGRGSCCQRGHEREREKERERESERGRDRERSRKNTGGKEDFIFGGWLEERSFSVPPPPPPPIPSSPTPTLSLSAVLFDRSFLRTISNQVGSKGHRIRAIG